MDVHVRAVVDGPGEDSSGEHVGKGHRPREFADQRRPQWATVSQLENTGAASTPSKDFRLLIEVHSSSGHRRGDTTQDRKSTRLNSSHVSSSYAVFCLKQKAHPPQDSVCIR